MAMGMQESRRIMFGYPESPESSPGGSFSRGLEIPGGPPMEGGLEELQNTIMAPFLYPFVEERNPAHPSGHSSFTSPSSGTCIYTSQGIQNGGYETWGCSQPTTQYIQPQNDFHLSRGTGQSIEHAMIPSLQSHALEQNTAVARDTAQHTDVNTPTRRYSNVPPPDNESHTVLTQHGRFSPSGSMTSYPDQELESIFANSEANADTGYLVPLQHPPFTNSAPGLHSPAGHLSPSETTKLRATNNRAKKTSMPCQPHPQSSKSSRPSQSPQSPPTSASTPSSSATSPTAASTRTYSTQSTSTIADELEANIIPPAIPWKDREIDTKDNQYPCLASGCKCEGKARFPRRSALQRHEEEHTRPYLCPVETCRRAHPPHGFSRRENLQTHLKSKNMHPGWDGCTPQSEKKIKYRKRGRLTSCSEASDRSDIRRCPILEWQEAVALTSEKNEAEAAEAQNTVCPAKRKRSDSTSSMEALGRFLHDYIRHTRQQKLRPAKRQRRK